MVIISPPFLRVNIQNTFLLFRIYGAFFVLIYKSVLLLQQKQQKNFILFSELFC